MRRTSAWRDSSGSTTRMRPARSAIGGFVESRRESGVGYGSILVYVGRFIINGLTRCGLSAAHVLTDRGGSPPPPEESTAVAVRVVDDVLEEVERERCPGIHPARFERRR